MLFSISHLQQSVFGAFPVWSLLLSSRLFPFGLMDFNLLYRLFNYNNVLVCCEEENSFDVSAPVAIVSSHSLLLANCNFHSPLIPFVCGSELCSAVMSDLPTAWEAFIRLFNLKSFPQTVLDFFRRLFLRGPSTIVIYDLIQYRSILLILFLFGCHFRYIKVRCHFEMSLQNSSPPGRNCGWKFSTITEDRCKKLQNAGVS